MLRQALSPTFLVILLGSALLWYVSKLSHEYTTDMPLSIRIDGEKYRLEAVVKGRGSNIVAQRLSLKNRLAFTIDELSSRRSTETPGALIITEASLQKAINGKIKDLEITQVTDAPEFIPPAVEEVKEPQKAEAADSEGGEGETPKEKRQRERAERREAKEAARTAEKALKEAEKAEAEAKKKAEEAAETLEKSDSK
jgi:hypothetical protein